MSENGRERKMGDDRGLGGESEGGGMICRFSQVSGMGRRRDDMPILSSFGYGKAEG
jgi:hypothetical protein